MSFPVYFVVQLCLMTLFCVLAFAFDLATFDRGMVILVVIWSAWMAMSAWVGDNGKDGGQPGNKP